MRQAKIVLILGLLFFGLSWFSSNSFSQNHPFLEYFPSNESIISISTDGFSGYPMTKQEITTCNPPSFGGVNVNQALADCRTCMGWKNTCPQCCIDSTTADYPCALDPTGAGPHGGYDPIPFDSNCDGGTRAPCYICDPFTGICSIDPVLEDCANRTLIPNCQRDGCPRNTSLTSQTSPDACVMDDGDGFIYCTKDDVTPADKGCVPRAAAQTEPGLSYNSIFHSPAATGSDFYTVTDFTGTCPSSATSKIQNVDPAFDPLTSPCYRYTDGAFATYFNACPGYADAAEAGYKDNRCCQESDACQPDGMGVCDTNAGGCQSIINNWTNLIYVSPTASKNCYDIQAFECIALQELVQNCINNSSPSECSACFQEIDSNFSFNFVAKSGESFVILWRIDSVPEVPAAMSPDFNTYFYSRIIVTDTTNRASLNLASNIIHQRNFTDAFNISSSVAITSDDLIVGHSYEARIHYFIPNDSNIPTGEHLSMIISRMEMDVFSVRE